MYLVTPAGILPGDRFEVSDPLVLLLPYQEVFERVLDAEVDKWSRPLERVAVSA
jgi:hypothetical protein